jgi:steroid Delta-isomerase
MVPGERGAVPQQLQPLLRWFETLTPQTVQQAQQLYAPDARFKDPFNDVQGPTAIAAIFTHMFEQVQQPRFVIEEVLSDGTQALLTWTMLYRRGDGAVEHRIRGSTHLRLDAQGRVCWHRDYWDAAEELYETLPVIGALMRWLRRRLQVPMPRDGTGRR